MKGIITRSTGSWYNIYSNGNYFNARLRGIFKKNSPKDTNPLAVGDQVEFEIDSAKNIVINFIYDRKNYIIRSSTNLSKKRHILAANIDQCFLFITLTQPKISTGFIDRFLISAEAYKIPVILLFNKIDLYDKSHLREKEILTKAYEKIGYKTLSISVDKNQNLEVLKSKLKEKISLFAGHSGVGKSTLINSLSPEHHLSVGELSKTHKKGKHTTTFAGMYSLSFGAWVIDIPGVKSFGLIKEITYKEIQFYFKEFFELKQKCSFYNCLHLEEPDCEVKKALEGNKIAPWRYQNYLNMLLDYKATYKRQ